MKAIRRIHKFDFSGPSAHVALVDAAANLQEVLILKKAEVDIAKEIDMGASIPTPMATPAEPVIRGQAQDYEVTVSLTMKDFLKKFFGMWEEDAATLAGILGYDKALYNQYVGDDGRYLTEDEMIERKIDSVALLKGAGDLPDTLPSSVHKIVEGLIKEFGDKLTTSEGSPLEDNLNSIGDSKLDQKDNTKGSEVDITKAAHDAVLAEMSVLKSEIEALKLEKATKAKTEMTELVKGLTFIEDSAKSALVDELIKINSAEVLKALECARSTIESAVSIEQEIGLEADIEQKDTKAVSSIEKSANLVKDILNKRKGVAK